MKSKNTNLNFFVALQNLPGGIKKGNIVIEKSADATKSPLVEKHNVLFLSYNPASETEFFKSVELSKFVAGETVYLPKEKTNPLGVSNSTPFVIEYVSYKNGKPSYTLVNKSRGIRTTSPESYLFQVETYWFISMSTGTIQSLPATAEHMETFAFKYRVLKQNVFWSKEDAQNELVKINNFFAREFKR
jgi:hypothetical protein